ncbi:MAG: ATP-binding protein [Anaerolineae bacterium]|nr:ATP-binding protein [Anaerolineae bacterium]
MAQKSMLLQLLEPGFAKAILRDQHRDDRGLLTDYIQFPFTAIVGQTEMKLALVLSVINPRVGGVLLIGPRGTAKTTAVRGLIDLLPPIEQSTCPYGCEPNDAETGGMDAVCTECATKLARGEPITKPVPMQLVELPLNSRLDDVIGGIDERAVVEHQRVRIEKGILAFADKNILYVDEINLLDRAVADAILDAAAQGRYTVRRGPLTATYRARIILVGSMNPEEGLLRPQIMDRLGLRVVVKRLDNAEERTQVYHNMTYFARAPYAMINDYAEDLLALSEEIHEAKELLPHVTATPPAEKLILEAILRLKIASNRTEFVALEAARAHAAADGRTMATDDDARAVAMMALRLRGSEFMDQYFERTMKSDDLIRETLDSL